MIPRLLFVVLSYGCKSLPFDGGGICEANDGGSVWRTKSVRSKLPQSALQAASSLKREPLLYPALL